MFCDSARGATTRVHDTYVAVGRSHPAKGTDKMPIYAFESRDTGRHLEVSRDEGEFKT